MPNERVFLDTSGWVAVLNAADALHAHADALWRDMGRRGTTVLVTDWVLAETGNGLARTGVRSRFATVARTALHDSRVDFVFITPTIAERALQLYASRADKQWGLVDCASFVVMNDHGVSKAFTADHHFRQAGFECLLLLA